MSEQQEMQYIKRDSFLALRPKTKLVELPDHGVKAIVRAMNGREREEFEQEGQRIQKGKAASPTIRAALVQNCTIDERGDRIFQRSDIEALNELDAAILDALFTAICELSGIQTQQKDKENAFPETPTDDSSSR